MTSKRVSLFAGTILGGALLLGTAGLALAQDPTATPSPSVTRGTFGGMMGSQGVQGMMGSQGVQGMMGSQGVQGMMGSQGVQGMMGSQGVQGMMGGMDAGDIAAMHRALGQNGTCDPKLMQSIHGKSSGAGS
jgi:hypothetical protein